MQGLDAQHRADLDRIIANRRAAGRLKSQASSPSADAAAERVHPPQPSVSPAAASPMRYAAESSSTAFTYSQPVQAPPPVPTRNPEATVANAEVGALRRQVTELQSLLSASQNDQSAKLGELQQGLRAVQETLVATGAQRQRSVVRTAGMMQSVPRMVPDIRNSGPRPVGPTGSWRDRSGPDPAAVSFGYKFGTIRSPGGPADPPEVSRPFSAATIDVESSVAILRTGDWWLKWNVTGTDVKPQYVWLNTETYVLQWGDKPSSSNFLSNFVKIEELINLETTQLVEHHDTGARIFYILVIKSHARVLRIGTEKKEKLNRWFEAINNLITFYRAYSRAGFRVAVSSD